MIRHIQTLALATIAGLGLLLTPIPATAAHTGTGAATCPFDDTGYGTPCTPCTAGRDGNHPTCPTTTRSRPPTHHPSPTPSRTTTHRPSPTPSRTITHRPSPTPSAITQLPATSSIDGTLVAGLVTTGVLLVLIGAALYRWRPTRRRTPQHRHTPTTEGTIV
jgi:hypothetical protein